MYKLIIVSWLFLLLAAPLQAQTQWFNPLEDGHAHYIQNQAWDEDGGNYNRLPARAKGKVRDAVWNLSRESAGLSIRFLTDSKKIQVRYQVTGGYSMPHMPATGVSGVDLYARVGGKSLVCYGDYSFADTIRYNYTIDRDISSDAKKEYELYLPLYNGVKWLEIGIEEGKELVFVPARKDRCVVVYGTSIAQGACASRPGMAWSNIVSRELDIPVVNLGFSGNGRLEKEVIDFICEVNAWAYVIDCMANLQDRPAEEVKTLAIKAVKQIREKTDAPILLVVSAFQCFLTLKTICNSTTCKILFRKPNPRRDKSGTKPQENKIKNASSPTSLVMDFSFLCKGTILSREKQTKSYKYTVNQTFIPHRHFREDTASASRTGLCCLFQTPVKIRFMPFVH